MILFKHILTCHILIAAYLKLTSATHGSSWSKTSDPQMMMMMVKQMQISDQPHYDQWYSQQSALDKADQDITMDSCSNDEADASMDSMIDLDDNAFDGSWMIHQNLDHGEMPEYKLQTSDFEHVQNQASHQSQDQPEDLDQDCPMGTMALDFMKHGLYFGPAKSMPQMQEIHSSYQNEGKTNTVETPTAVLYNKIALADKRTKLAEKFPIMSSKLIAIKGPQQFETIEQDQQLEQQKTFDVDQEQIRIDSVLSSVKAVPIEQQKTQQVAVKQQLPVVQTNISHKNSKSLLQSSSSGLFGQDFTTARPFKEANGQRARESLRRASDAARALRVAGGTQSIHLTNKTYS